MRIHRFGSLDGITDEHLIETFSIMKDREFYSSESALDEDSYEWKIGEGIFMRLKETYGKCLVQSCSFGKYRYMGIDMKVFRPGFKPLTIMLVEKPIYTKPKKLVGDLLTGYHYTDADTAAVINAIDEKAKRELNAVYGRQAFSKKEDKTMNPYLPRNAVYGLLAPKIEYDKLYNAAAKRAIKKVIFNDPATIVYWADETKTVVRAEGEKFDPEKGLAVAIAKKYFGNEGNYYDIFKKWLPKEEVPEFLNKKMNLSEEQLLEKEDDDSTEILTAKQLAEKVGLSVSTVLRDCRRGIHPGAQKVDGKWLIPYSGLVGGNKNDN